MGCGTVRTGQTWIGMAVLGVACRSRTGCCSVVFGMVLAVLGEAKSGMAGRGKAVLGKVRLGHPGDHHRKESPPRKSR